nr:6488_t:CDS:2 [Entrophospora candida]
MASAKCELTDSMAFLPPLKAKTKFSLIDNILNILQNLPFDEFSLLTAFPFLTFLLDDESVAGTPMYLDGKLLLVNVLGMSDSLFREWLLLELSPINGIEHSFSNYKNILKDK